MCIIAYKKEGGKFPENKELYYCFQNNPDGAGYMYVDKGKVHIVKGLMTFEDFISSLEKTVSIFGVARSYVLHFRLSTQAGVRKDCTHPYPLSDKMSDLRKLKAVCDIGIAHNGIISLTSNKEKKKITYNDTMTFITKYLAILINNKFYYKNRQLIKLIKKLTNSKLAILDNTGHCEIIGDNWIEAGDMLYSNDTYLPYIPFVYQDFEYFEYFGFEDPEIFYNTDSGMYNFPEDYCPGVMNIFDYCNQCQNLDKCYEIYVDIH